VQRFKVVIFFCFFAALQGGDGRAHAQLRKEPAAMRVGARRFQGLYYTKKNKQKKNLLRCSWAPDGSKVCGRPLLTLF
jgi:hypothetical protein